jgi:farnesol dehydrogenase
MRVLVTGGTGFLGRAIVATLARRHEVRLLVRPTASRERFPSGVAFAPGDVTDRASLEMAAAGCDAILHAAALVKILAPAAAFERVNVGGLHNVLAAGEAAGVSRVLYVSSFIALGPSEEVRGGTHDESSEPERREWINPYERTKTFADRLARQAIAAGAPLLVVYPGVVYGPGELTEGNIVVRHILDLLHGRLPALIGSPDQRWNYAFVEDVAAGIARVLEAAALGRRYVLGGENVRLGRFYELVAELSGRPVPRRRIPDRLATALGAAMVAWARLAGTTPRLTPDLVEIYRHDWALDSSLAEAELGYRRRPLREGLEATLAWLKETGRW